MQLDVDHIKTNFQSQRHSLIFFSIQSFQIYSRNSVVTVLLLLLLQPWRQLRRSAVVKNKNTTTTTTTRKYVGCIWCFVAMDDMQTNVTHFRNLFKIFSHDWICIGHDCFSIALRNDLFLRLLFLMLRRHYCQTFVAAQRKQLFEGRLHRGNLPTSS